MRIWHEKLIPKLCQKHLCAVWREGWGCYNIITQDKKGYRNHPAVKEFEYSPSALWLRLMAVRNEMVSRGYHPKELPELKDRDAEVPQPIPWQSLEQQIEVLKSKGCKCQIS